jgi:galactose mutarotase-like enzyme
MLTAIENISLSGTVDTFGGELIALNDGYTDYLWSGDETYWGGRSPHLFPVIGALKNNELIAENKICMIGKHGFLRNSEFTIYEKKEDSILLFLKSSEETLKMYPYEFTFYVTHTLTKKGFKTSYRIVNDDSKNIYFNAGGHVGVRCPLQTGEEFIDYEIAFSKPLTSEVYFPASDAPLKRESAVPFFNDRSRLELSHEYFKKGPVIIDSIEVKSLTLKSMKSNTGIKFIYEDFPVLALWTFGEKHAPYICLEPWHGLPAMEEDIEFCKKPYIIELAPGQDKVLSYEMEIM